MSQITRASLLWVFLFAWMSLDCEAAPQKNPKNQQEAIVQGINELEQLYQQQLDDRWAALQLDDVTKALLENPTGSRRALVHQLGGVTPESSLRIKSLIGGSETRIRQYKRDKAEYPDRIAQFRATLDAPSDKNLFSLGVRVNVSLQGARNRTKRAHSRLEEAKKLKDSAADIRETLASLLDRIEQQDKQTLGCLKEIWENETEPWRVKSHRGEYNLEEHLHLKRMPKLRAELEHCVDSLLPWLENRLKGQLLQAEQRHTLARDKLESTQH